MFLDVVTMSPLVSRYSISAEQVILPLWASSGSLTLRILCAAVKPFSCVATVVTEKSSLSDGIGFPLWLHSSCRSGLPVALHTNWIRGGLVSFGWMMWS